MVCSKGLFQLVGDIHESVSQLIQTQARTWFKIGIASIREVILTKSLEAKSQFKLMKICLRLRILMALVKLKYFT